MELGVEAFLQGNLKSAGSATLRDRARIDGNTETGGSLTRHNQTQVIGTMAENVVQEPCHISEKSLSIGSKDITVANDQSDTLQPGNYRDLQVYSRATVYLKKGIYHFRNFRLEPDVQVILIENSGTEINVQDNLALADRTLFSFSGSDNPLALKIYSHQQTSLRLGADSRFVGVVTAPKAEIIVASRVQFVGHLFAQKITIEPNVLACTPPRALGFHHSEGAYGPYFDPNHVEYRATVPVSTTQISLGALLERNSDEFRINGGTNPTVPFPGDSLRIDLKVSRPAVSGFPVACFESHYFLTLKKSENYSVRVRDAAPCSGGACDGSSWETAFKDLQAGLDTAQREGREIWLAEGTYKPSARRQTADARSATFLLGSGAELHGGFDGRIEENLETRRGSVSSCLISGDIAGTDGEFPADSQLTADNTYHVLTLKGKAPGSIILDRITMTRGVATGAAEADQHGGGMFLDGASPLIREVVWTRNFAKDKGGALFTQGSVDVKVINSYVVENRAGESGGGFALEKSEGSFGNLIFAKNIASVGGGISLWNSSPSLRFSTIAVNGATTGGGLFAGGTSHPVVDHAVLWANSAHSGAGVARDTSASPSFRFSDVQGAIIEQNWNTAVGQDGGGNLSLDPIFRDPTLRAFGTDGIAFSQDDGFQLAENSPVMDKGESSIPPEFSLDIFGVARPMDGDRNGTENADMGSYEHLAVVVSGDLQIGYFSETTGRFFPRANPMIVADYLKEEFGKLGHSNAANTIRIEVGYNKHLKDKIYGKISGLEENGSNVASPVTVWFYKNESESTSKKWVYMSRRAMPPNVAEGKPIYFVSEPSLRDEHLASGYLVPAKPGIRLKIVFPHSQF